ncbi:MAG: nicotinate (nicotinamide) nucleotide adenylyltransferase [Clostridia bacterium]|nr:nicotinate (nicotinamide) nucleotide adenylyltransferase [Clostridia bacterium]
MKKIAILGGTFNPVHVEHVKMAVAAIKELELDKLIIVPTFLPPHKNVVPASGADRINMLKIAFKGVSGVEISDFETLNGGKSYSYITTEHFAEEYKGARLYMIVGGDMLADFKTWKYPERILAAASLAVFRRQDYFCDLGSEREYFIKRFGTEFMLLNYVGKTVSSTAIRTYLAFGLKPNGVPEGVFDYIKERGVYPADEYQRYILSRLPIKRVIHTANVVICALKKAKELGLDYEKVRIAATLHDCAKYADVRNYRDFSLPQDVPAPVVHAFLGAYIAEKELGISDGEILDAIRYHTSGKAEMSTLAKLIFVADMIEEGRTYQGVEKLRAEYDKDFENCFKECLKEEVLHLVNKKEYIYAETLNAYDYYVKSRRENE